MKNIDLFLYAKTSKKIPKQILFPLPSIKKFNHWKLVIGHFLDLLIIGILNVVLVGGYTKYIDRIISFNGLKFNQANSISMIFLIYPILVFTYFFFSYFLNHGQSYGMFVMKSRLKIKSKSFVDSLIWSFHSTLLCFSFGLSYFSKKARWRYLGEHDYLYHDLMSSPDKTLMNLIPLHSIATLEKNTTWYKAS